MRSLRPGRVYAFAACLAGECLLYVVVLVSQSEYRPWSTWIGAMPIAGLVTLGALAVLGRGRFYEAIVVMRSVFALMTIAFAAAMLTLFTLFLVPCVACMFASCALLGSDGMRRYFRELDADGDAAAPDEGER